MIAGLLGIFGFCVLLPMIIWGIFHEDELIEFENRAFNRR